MLIDTPLKDVTPKQDQRNISTLLPRFCDVL